MKDIPIDNVLPPGATLQDIYVNDSDDLESIGRQLEGSGWHGAGQACTQLWQELTDQVERNPRTEVICAKITFESHDHQAAPVVLGRVMLFSVGGIHFARALVVFSKLECEKEALLALYAMGRSVRRAVLRTYYRECEKALEHRRWLKGDRLTSQRNWEPVLAENKLAQAILASAEIRWLSHDLEHQLRVLRQTGRTGYERHY